MFEEFPPVTDESARIVAHERITSPVRVKLTVDEKVELAMDRLSHIPLVDGQSLEERRAKIEKLATLREAALSGRIARRT